MIGMVPFVVLLLLVLIAALAPLFAADSRPGPEDGAPVWFGHRDG